MPQPPSADETAMEPAAEERRGVLLIFEENLRRENEKTDEPDEPDEADEAS